MVSEDFKRQESRRVQAYRQRKAQEGFKNITFVASPEEYQEIERERERLNLTTKELFFYHLRGQVAMEGRGYSSPYYDHLEMFDPDFNLPMPERLLDTFEKDQKRGECFKLTTTRRERRFRKYVIAEFIYKAPSPREENFFPFEMRWVNRGYETYEEAMRAYLSRKPRLKLRKNAQHTLLRRKYEKIPDIQQVVKDWYIPVFHLKSFYPGQPLGWRCEDDKTNYEQEFERISNLMELEQF